MKDFFAGGSDTVSKTVDWAVLYMIHHPDVQMKLYEEVERVVGKSILPTIGNRNR